MPRTKYTVGQVAEDSLVITDDNTLEFVDPTTVSIEIQREHDTKITLVYGVSSAIIKTSTGHYDLYYNTTGKAPGIYRLQWIGSGAVILKKQIKIELLESEI